MATIAEVKAPRKKPPSDARLNCLALNITQTDRPAKVSGIAVSNTVLKRLNVVNGPIKRFNRAENGCSVENAIITKEIKNAIKTATTKRIIEK